MPSDQTTKNAIIERVAQAIFDNFDRNPAEFDGSEWHYITEDVRDEWRYLARIALDAAADNPTTKIQERGPWSVGCVSKRVYLQSEDFTHDARLYVDGNFEGYDQKMEYAQEITRRLNARAGAANDDQ